MKFTNIILGTSIVSLCTAAERDLRGWGRGGRGGGGGGGRHGGRGKGLFAGRDNCYWAGEEGDSGPFLERLGEHCANTSYDCESVVEENSCSNWETVDNEDTMFVGCLSEMTEEQMEEHKDKMQAKREEWLAMTDAERADIKAKRDEVKASNAATLLECGCCQGVESVAALVKGKEGQAAKTLGFRRPRGDGGQGFGGGGGPGGNGHGFGGHGHGGGRPGGHGGGQGFGGGDGTDFDCPEGEDITDHCSQLATFGFGCEHFDSTSMMRGRQKGYMFYCKCCTNVAGAEEEEEGSDQGGD